MPKPKPKLEPLDFTLLGPDDEETLWEAKQLMLAIAPVPPGWHGIIRDAFRKLGFRTTLVERSAIHPVWSIHFAQPADKVCRDLGQLSRLLKRALRNIGVTTPPGRLAMRLAGRYVILSFIGEMGEPGELLGAADQCKYYPPPVEVEPEPAYDEGGFAGVEAWP
jgi:hypothetical protein